MSSLPADSRRPGRAPVALLVHPGAELYGSDRVLLDSARALLLRGWAVTVALPTSGPLAVLLEAAGATVVECRTPVLRKRALQPAGMARLILDTAAFVGPARRLLSRVRPDVVYVSTVTIPWWLLIARALGHAVLCHVHEAETGVPSWMQRLLALPLHAADLLVVNSRFSRDVVLASAPGLAERSSVVLNPVPGPPSATPCREHLDGDAEVLFVGRLSPRKGPQVAIAAVRELTRRGLGVRLTLVGAVFSGYEWFEDSLHEQVASAGLAERVRFVGFVDDVWPSLAAADIVVVPSVADEPFGNAAVEAVLSARPVIASDSGGLVEAVGGYRSATVVPRDDPAALADAIEQVTATWSHLRDAAIEDAAVAAGKHSLETYAGHLDAEMHRAARRREDRRRRRPRQAAALRSR